MTEDEVFFDEDDDLAEAVAAKATRRDANGRRIVSREGNDKRLVKQASKLALKKRDAESARTRGSKRSDLTRRGVFGDRVIV